MSVTVSRARDLDRAMLLLQKGRITYGRWVETLDAWVRGEDVTGWDYGEAESLADRIARACDGRVVAPSDVAEELKCIAATACVALKRMAADRRALKLRHGRYRIGRAR